MFPDMVTTAEGLQLNRAFAKIRDGKVRRRIVDLVCQIAESEAQRNADAQKSSLLIVLYKERNVPYCLT